MYPSILIQGQWDEEAEVWTVKSSDVPGLVIEADTWAAAIKEIELVLPDLLEISGQRL
jgi:hypothetical protein